LRHNNAVDDDRLKDEDKCKKGLNESNKTKNN